MTDPKPSTRAGGGLVDRHVGRVKESAGPENNELAGRLEQLDAKADAPEEKEAALKAAYEARRLRAAASNAEAERKEADRHDG